jgi:membrane fusion protein (multidrug efflux system)
MSIPRWRNAACCFNDAGAAPGFVENKGFVENEGIVENEGRMKIAIRILIMLFVAGIVFGGVFFFDAFRGKMIAKYMKAFANPTETISAAVATAQPWQQTVEVVGSLRAMNGADLSSDTSGIVEAINFKSGDDVAAGTVLLRLRSEDDPARLQQLQTAVSLAQTNYQRDLRQLQAQAVARATVDTDLSNLRSAQAAVAQQQASMAKKTIVAPFAGHLGIREVDVGQYVPAGTSIVTLQALDPIYVDFYVPQQDMAQMKIGQSVTVKVDTYAGRVFTGRIEAVNARVDTATRTLQVRAAIANADRALLPGMFATVAVAIGAPQSLVTLPQTAVTYNAYGSTVFLVQQGNPAAGSGTDAKPTLVARQVFVATGPTRGDQVAVLHGVAAGDRVVIAGQSKLHNGSPVAINNSVVPSDDADPHPVQQ